jgi:predicted alpha/beta superfamily hydrolase
MANQTARETGSLVVLMILAALAVSSCAESERLDPINAGDTNPLAHLPALRGDYFPFESRAVGRSFHIYIRLPENYQADETDRYPVVYVLDGDSLFPILAASHLFLTIDEGLPEVIVVGIAYGSFDPSINMRGYDFSAPVEADPERGGAQAFHDFLKTELIPRIEHRYRADPSQRVLFGQSRGGSMVLYSAFTDPDLFWGRIASNPVFDPGRELFFSPTAPARRADLRLAVTSGSNDIPDLREAALEWFSAWEAAEDKPWSLHTVTIDGGTHAADSSNSYRAGMLWLFDRTR